MKDESIAQQFLTRSASLLRDDFLPKIREAVELLSDEEIWARAGDASNSIGNLLLHLSGNVRQHIIAGVGQRIPDARNRPLEFAARGGISKDVLVGELERTIAEACAVLDSLDPAQLSEEGAIQGKKVALFDDIFHVVEHFAYHVGQIILIVKAQKQRGFDWWKHLDA